MGITLRVEPSRFGRRSTRPMSVVRWRANGVEGVTSQAETTLHHLQEDAQLHVIGGRLSRGDGYASASREARQSLARVGAILRPRQHNRFYVHASGVVNRNGAAFIFVGESGSGKSTVAFALTRQDWRMLGDDGVVLEPLGDVVTVHGWRSPLMVSASLSSFFPEIQGKESRAIAGDERQRIPMDRAHVRHARLGAIVFVSRGNSGSLRVCGQSNALSSLVRQSPWVLLGDSESASHFNALRSIVGTVPLLEFVHCPVELRRIGDFFDSAA